MAELYQMRVSFNCAGQHAMCVFNYKSENNTNQDDFEVALHLAEAADFDGGAGSFFDKLMDMCSNESFLSVAHVIKIYPVGGNGVAFQFASDDYPGDVNSPIESFQAATVINWVPFTEQNKLGRTFVPGVPSDALTSSRWNADQYTRVGGFVARFLPGFSTVDGVFEPCVLSAGPLGRLIQNGYLAPRPGTMRRRELPV